MPLLAFFAGVCVSMSWTSPGLPEWAEILAECERQQVSEGPSEFHGCLCGWLAGGATDRYGFWAGLEDEPPDEHDPMWRLFQATASQLSAPEYGFNLLLPDADAPLHDRCQALLAWCRGFADTFEMTIGGDRRVLPQEAQDILSDLFELAAEDIEVEGGEKDEQSFMRLEEFVRMAALFVGIEYARMLQQRSLH